LKAKILMLVVAAMLLVGSALPALANHGPTGGPDTEPVCDWDWDRYLWNNFEYELWYYGCDFGEGEWDVQAFWTPNDGYWYP
jgi:hypothetical protein